MHNTWLRFDVPEDGLPSIDDWITTFSSILLDGLDLGREPLDVSVWSLVFEISFKCWSRPFKHMKCSSVQLSSTWTNHVWHRNAWSDYQVLPMVVWLMFCFFPGRVCKRQSPSCNKLHKEHGDFDSQAHFHCSDFEPCLHNSMSSCGSGPWTC